MSCRTKSWKLVDSDGGISLLGWHSGFSKAGIPAVPPQNWNTSATHSTKTWHCFPSLSECRVVSRDTKRTALTPGQGWLLLSCSSEAWSQWGACWETCSAGRVHPLHSKSSVCTWLILLCQSVPVSSFVYWCQLLSFSSLTQTNGYDGDLYGSQSLSRRSGRVRIVNVHDAKLKQVAAKPFFKSLLNLGFFGSFLCYIVLFCVCAWQNES